MSQLRLSHGMAATVRPMPLVCAALGSSPVEAAAVTAPQKICAGCDSEQSEFYTLGENKLPGGAVVVVGLCEECYHRGHRSRRHLSALNRRVQKRGRVNPERYRAAGERP